MCKGPLICVTDAALASAWLMGCMWPSDECDECDEVGDVVFDAKDGRFCTGSDVDDR